MRVAPVRKVAVFEPLRGPVPLPANGVPSQGSQAGLPVVALPRREAALITCWHGTLELSWPPRRSEAPDIRRASCPEGRKDQRRKAGDRGNHRHDDPRRSSKKLLLRCFCGWRWGHVSPPGVRRPRRQHPRPKRRMILLITASRQSAISTGFRRGGCGALAPPADLVPCVMASTAEGVSQFDDVVLGLFE